MGAFGTKLALLNVRLSVPATRLPNIKGSVACTLTLAIVLQSPGVMVKDPLIVPELASALFKRMRRGDLALDDGEAALASFLRLGVHLVSMALLGGPALRLAHRFGLKAPYDAHYLALAEREGCELWTADERLWNAVRHELSWVRWIGEAPTPPPRPSGT